MSISTIYYDIYVHWLAIQLDSIRPKQRQSQAAFVVFIVNILRATINCSQTLLAFERDDITFVLPLKMG